MTTYTIQGASGKSRLLFGASLDDLSDYVAGRHSVIVTDEQVYQLYHDRFPRAEVAVIGTGEGSKTMQTTNENPISGRPDFT